MKKQEKYYMKSRITIRIKRSTLQKIEKAIVIIAFGLFSLYVWIAFFNAI